ncbi:MAG: hypothetical protein P4M11_09865, partial [Candidatus Pacebacteria bacterium]|nr:hypothetical protein [Candidatus Paceibacterota bacterium]
TERSFTSFLATHVEELKKERATSSIDKLLTDALRIGDPDLDLFSTALRTEHDLVVRDHIRRTAKERIAEKQDEQARMDIDEEMKNAPSETVREIVKTEISKAMKSLTARPPSTASASSKPAATPSSNRRGPAPKQQARDASASTSRQPRQARSKSRRRHADPSESRSNSSRSDRSSASTASRGRRQPRRDSSTDRGRGNKRHGRTENKRSGNSETKHRSKSRRK